MDFPLLQLSEREETYEATIRDLAARLKEVSYFWSSFCSDTSHAEFIL